MSGATLRGTWHDGIPTLLGGLFLLGVAIAAVFFLGSISGFFVLASAAVLTRGFDRFIWFPVALVLGCGLAAAVWITSVSAILG